MALSGAIFVGFVFGHMIGNLQIYLPVGPDGVRPIDHYGRFLHEGEVGRILWAVRAFLFGAVAVHIWAATVLTLKSLGARPQGYRAQQYMESTYASRTMRWGGAILGLFVIFHILHLTLLRFDPNMVEGHVYDNMVRGFQNPFVSGFYILAMCALGLHLRHGFWSFLQTLSLEHPRYNVWRRLAANAFALLIVVGNCSIPIAVLAGFLK
jgi:succinate dehydrogenase / fumarate reductase cytochrome b subunit